MRCEWPVVTKCCFCVPLRKGLLAWGYLKLVLNLFVALLLSIHLYEVTVMRSHIPRPGVIILSVIILIFVNDALFQLMFIISAHKKIYKYMRWYYRYSIVVLVAVFMCSLIYISYLMYALREIIFVILFFPFAIPLLLLIIFYQFVHLYFIILSRSEFMKLKNNAQFQFVNTMEEARCTVVVDSETIP